MDVVILGRIGYDLYSEEPNVPLPQVRRFSRYLGGSSANMAVGLSRLGATVGIVSCAGRRQPERLPGRVPATEKASIRRGCSDGPGSCPRWR